MAQLEGIRIQNYRALKDIVLGRTFENRDDEQLPRMVAIIGPNGCGKSTVMDALGFIGDCLRLGVEEACDQPHRGGFEKLRTRGQTGPIQFEIYYRESWNARPISYSLHINTDDKERPIVAYERFRQRRKGESRGQPYSFLEVANGEGYAWAGESTETEEGSESIPVRLDDRRRLGVATLGNLTEHPRVVSFRKFLEGWYLSYFVPDLARSLPVVGAQKHLSRKGDNLANYLQHMERQFPKDFAAVLTQVSAKIPGITNTPTVKDLFNEGIPLGTLWFSNHFGKGNP
jgi:predicted ATPase